MVQQEGEHHLEGLVRRFAEALRGQRGLSKNTVRVYSTDLRPFVDFLEKEILDPKEFDRHYLRRYLAWLSTTARGSDGGYARVSVARKLVALRSFYRFLVQEGVIATNPIPKGRSFTIKVEKRLPGFLGRGEVERLLAAPDVSERLGMRDRAILELLYSSGVRLSELHGLDMGDVSLDTREVRVTREGVERAGRSPGQACGRGSWVIWSSRQALSGKGRYARPVPQPLRWEAIAQKRGKDSREIRHESPAARRGSIPILCATPSRPTSCKGERTSAWCKSCWATPVRPPPRYTPT